MSVVKALLLKEIESLQYLSNVASLKATNSASHHTHHHRSHHWHS